jgi:hypothetical protein
MKNEMSSALAGDTANSVKKLRHTSKGGSFGKRLPRFESRRLHLNA